MFIEIEQDTYLINDTFAVDGVGRIELTEEQAKVIATSKYGHIQFMYIDGELIESLDATAEIDLSLKRANASLSPLEFWKSIERLGIAEQVDAIRVSQDTPREIVLEIEKASEFKRNWPTLIQLAADLGVTEQQLDNEFGIG